MGLWREAALHDGLRFGVSWHADQRGWDYYAPSYGADKTGPLAGVPYDGRNPANASLYNPVHVPKTRPSQDWLNRWTKRQMELIDKYHPDLLYYDGGISFPQDGGMQVVAHYLDLNTRLHGGKCEGVVNTKDENFTQDYERGDPITHPPAALAMRHVPGRLVLPGRPDRRFPVPEQEHRDGDQSAGRRRQQERQPADELPAARRRQPVPGVRDGAGRAGPVDADQRRGDFRHPALDRLRGRPDRPAGRRST